MGCCGEREKFGDVRAEQKWDYINLSDFKSTSCFAPLSYGILYIMLLISISVYAVDTFTAVNLLVFDRWSGKIKPFIPLSISRWIFAGCIILSFALLFYRWMRAIRVMKGGAVAQSYLDPLAVRIQSIRMGKEGQGFRRFLLFGALTKSRKGADYVALFTYFSFEAWLRIVFAEGPRQVVNALTLYSVMKLNLIPQGEHAAKDGRTPIAQFFVNVQALADSNKEQAVILFGMLWTLVIWVISAINLAVAVIMYLLFLWHHIPIADGGLSAYCRRKINGRLKKIVGAKMDKALAKENELRQREEAKGDRPGEIKRQPTIPIMDSLSEDKLPNMPMLSRQTTQTTLPPYSSPPPTARSDAGFDFGFERQPTLPDLVFSDSRPLPPSRTTTQSSARSNASYASNAPLMGAANGMGYGPQGRTQSPVSPPLPSGYDSRPPMNRSMTGHSQGTQRSYTPDSRPPTSQGRRTPGPYPMGPIPRPGTAMSGPRPSVGRQTPRPSPIDTQGRRTPGPPPSLRSQTPGMTRNPGDRSYVAFNPNIHSGPSSNSSTPTSGQNPRLYRDFTEPNPAVPDYFGLNQRMQQGRPPPQRSSTAPLPQQSGGYDDCFLDSYADSGPPRMQMPPRAATTTPGGGWNGQRRPTPGGPYGGPRY